MRTIMIMAAGLVAASTCKPSKAHEAEHTTTDAPPGVEAHAYTVSLTQTGPYRAHSQAEAAISIDAKPGYHVNPDYPVKFTVGAESNVTFREAAIPLLDKLQKTPCATEADQACGATATIPFTVEAAGPVTVAGTLAFSVCSKDQCLIEKVPLKLVRATQ